MQAQNGPCQVSTSLSTGFFIVISFRPSILFNLILLGNKATDVP
jgi:hypothetical protein